MIDLDVVEVSSNLTLQTHEPDLAAARAMFCAMHSAGNGYAILLRVTDDTAGGSGAVIDVAVDRKSAKMIINYLQTIYEL